MKRAGFESVRLDRQLRGQGYSSAREVFLGVADTVKGTLRLIPWRSGSIAQTRLNERSRALPHIIPREEI